MNFVTISDFDKIPYNLPPKDVQNTDFESWMDIEEEKVLRCLLGHLFYDELIANALYLPEEKWSRLVDGAYYVYSGIDYKWIGLNKMLKPYLYVMRTKQTLDHHTSTGIELAQVETALKISFRQRAADAWNVFVNAYGIEKNQRESLYGFIQANLTDYTNFKYPLCGAPCYPKQMNSYGL